MRSLTSVLLLPLSLLYGIAVWFRNVLFNRGILKQKTFSLPVICIGNITAGGTGKTPHVDYVLSVLKKRYRLATLSRGYKRDTKGFCLADGDTQLDTLGDEAYMLYKKHHKDGLKVAVDANRKRGIKALQELVPSLDAVIMDDGFQHRYVKPGMSILLVDYTRPMFNDFLLPYGRLRECRMEKYRANVIIVTKVPPDIKPIDIRIFKKKLKAKPYQYVFFSSIVYDEVLQPVFSSTGLPAISPEKLLKKSAECVLVSGIANPKPLLEQIERLGFALNDHLAFPDHHQFSERDVRRFEKSSIKDNVVLVTTEKDAVRLQKIEKHIPKEVKDKMFYYPMSIKILGKKESDFDELLLAYMKRGTFPTKLSM